MPEQYSRTFSAALGIWQAIVLPMFFASSALYPVSSMPPLLQVFAIVNPMTYVVDAVRSLLITGNLAQLPLDIPVIVAFDIVLFAMASVTFKKITE